MGRRKDQWSGPWAEVVSDLRNACGGKWTGVVDAIETLDKGVTAQLVPDAKDRRDGTAKLIRNWGSRGTAPPKAAANALSQLLNNALNGKMYKVGVGGDGTELSAVEILQHRLQEAGQWPMPVTDRFELSRASIPDSRGLLYRHGRCVYPRVVRRKLQLTDTATRSEYGLVSTDGAFIAARDGVTLRVARLNRASGRTAEWQQPLDLAELGDGDLLAIDSLGRADIAFIWAGESGTAIYRGRRDGSIVDVVQRLSTDRASAAVLNRVRAMLSFPDSDRAGGDCAAFPELGVTSLQAALAQGQLIVLAVGMDRDGRSSAWVEVNGRHRQEMDSEVALELHLGTLTTPRLVASDGAPVELSPARRATMPFEHWVSPHLVGQAAIA